jgi:hypothetical protein
VPAYIHGHVYDCVKGKPVAGASVTVENEYNRTTFYTDVKGYYLGKVVGVTSLIIVAADNYAPRSYHDVDIYYSGLTEMSFKLQVPLPPGDINQDGNVDLEDAVPVFQTLTQSLSSLNTCGKTDISGDDKIGFEELIFILKKLAETE